MSEKEKENYFGLEHIAYFSNNKKYKFKSINEENDLKKNNNNININFNIIFFNNNNDNNKKKIN